MLIGCWRIVKDGMLPDHQVNPSLCPFCGMIADAAMASSRDQGEEGPETGSLALCADCGCFSMWGDGLVLRVIPWSFWRDLDAELLLVMFKARAAWEVARGFPDAGEADRDADQGS